MNPRQLPLFSKNQASLRTTIWQADNYDKHLHTCRKGNRARHENARTAALSILGNACAICGITDVRVLQIDHKTGGGTQEGQKIGRYAIYRRVAQDSSPYQLLCANHNWIKKVENKEHKERLS